ncbi:hypothetical protein AC477_05815, partial [miscellaneous Crenarchaeota group-1 archaeon SG8-32-1]
AKVGFNVYNEKIMIPNETQKICKHFGVDPLQLISSGSLLIATKEEMAEKIIQNLSKSDVQASIIGEIIEPTFGRNLISKAGNKTELVRPLSDHLWKALEKPVKI